MNSDSLEKCVENYIIEHKNIIYRLAYSYVRNQEDALDVVQESIYKAFLSIDSLKSPSAIKTWFYRIVVNTSIDFIRKRKKEILVDESFIENCNLSQSDHYSDFDLKKSLDSLPKEYKTIVILRYFEDLKIKEISEILNQNINTIKTKLYKALSILRINIAYEQEDLDE